MAWLSLKAPWMLSPERSSRGMQCDRNMVMRPQSSELDALDSLHHDKSPVRASIQDACREQNVPCECSLQGAGTA